MKKLNIICLLAGTGLLQTVGAQQTPIALTGWNVVDIVGNAAPSASAVATSSISGWDIYEQGYPGSSQGVPTTGLFTSAYNSAVQFQLQPYAQTSGAQNNAAQGSGGITLSLATPAAFSSLQFLTLNNGGQGFYVTLNFSDSTTSSAYYPTPFNGWGDGSNAAFLNVGLINNSSSSIYSGLNLAEGDITLSGGDSAKTIDSITYTVYQDSTATALFAVSGNAVAPVPEPSTLALACLSGIVGLAMFRRK